MSDPDVVGGQTTIPMQQPVSWWQRVTNALPTGDMIAMKILELRRRRGLMIAAVALIVGLPVVVYGVRIVFQIIDPAQYGPAGSRSALQTIMNPLTEFGFITAAAVGAAAATTDLSDGMFRHLVITGRSRVALFLARIPTGLAILLPLTAVSFAVCWLVTVVDGDPAPTSVDIDGTVQIPVGLTESGFQAWLDAHPEQALQAFPRGTGAMVDGISITSGSTSSRYSAYLLLQHADQALTGGDWIRIGGWLALIIVVGFVVALGLGALTGQRTVTLITLIALQVIVTPLMARATIPHFLDGQRAIVGVAIDQIRPGALSSGVQGHQAGLLGGAGGFDLPPMPTWAVILVIAGWLVGWSVIGARRMATRDA